MSTRIGTSNFESLAHARRYYEIQHGNSTLADTKLKNKEIVIGPPKVKDNEKLSIDRDGRYQIETN